MKYKAHAKINIRLNVLGKNESNYHNLCMVNARLRLADEIEIIESDNNCVKYSTQVLNNIDNNYCLALLNEITSLYNIDKKFQVYIKKNIPLGAGLGGGSADAACIINALNEICKLNLTLEEKIKLGLKYGADIPYCLTDNLAIVEGIGEKITKLDVPFCERVVLVYPNLSVSTKDVFKKVKHYSISCSKELIEKYILENDFKKLLQNDLEIPCFELNPILKHIKDKLSFYGPVIMSGSGSTMLIFIKDDNILEQIRKEFPFYLIIDTYILK